MEKKQVACHQLIAGIIATVFQGFTGSVLVKDTLWLWEHVD